MFSTVLKLPQIVPIDKKRSINHLEIFHPITNNNFPTALEIELH